MTRDGGFRALVRDTKLDSEREQAVRLVRAFATIPGTQHAGAASSRDGDPSGWTKANGHTTLYMDTGGAHVLSRSLVATLIAIAESDEDKLAGVCLETLCELAIADVALVAECGGMRVVRPGAGALYSCPALLSRLSCSAITRTHRSWRPC